VRLLLAKLLAWTTGMIILFLAGLFALSQNGWSCFRIAWLGTFCLISASRPSMIRPKGCGQAPPLQFSNLFSP